MDISLQPADSRQSAGSSDLQPEEATKSKIEEIAASVAADDSATQTSEAQVQETAAFEESPAPVIAENSSEQAELREPTAVEEIASAVVVDGSATQGSEAQVQETAAVEESPAPVIAENSSGQAEVQEPTAVEEIAPPVVTNDGAVQSGAPPVQQAIEVEISTPSSPGPIAEEKQIAKTLLGFYGLSEQPFSVTPDPVYLYLSRAHREAFTSLSQGVQNLRGFMALVAEPGMGKTTLLNKLMEELRDSARIVFLFQTQCNSRELLRYLLGELGIQHAGMDLVAMHRALNDFLFQEMLEGRRFVLIVDEAQNLQDSVLETLRLLSDFETTHAKLLQIVLAGQPQLAGKLMRPNLSQLRQRIAVLANLEALDAAETARYIEHRLRVAGTSEAIFTPEAVAQIAERSQGIPRNINNICFNALLLGYSQERKVIDADLVQQVVAKLDLESLSPRRDSQQSGLARESQPAPGTIQEAQAKVRATLTGKLTELVRSRPWSKDEEFKLQVLLEREPSSEIHVAERYYSCSFYVSAEQAAAFRLRQPIRIKFEQE